MESFIFEHNRQKFFEKMQNNSIAFLASAQLKHRNSDTEYPFRQDSNFYYITGFNESKALAVLIKSHGKCRYILFCQERNPDVERRVGARAGLKGALEIYGADEAYEITEAPLRIPDFFSEITTIYYLINYSSSFEKKLFSWLRIAREKRITLPRQFNDLREILHAMRVIKSEAELIFIRKACEISALAHVKAMENCREGMFEYELEAVLLHTFCKNGAQQVAYPSIVAGGNHACTLHYTRNNAVLEKGSLVLIDAGAECQNYAADITRTFPVNGKFSATQQSVYEIVLAAQTAAIDLIRPGILWNEIQACILKVMVQGLVDLKILKGNVTQLIETKAYLPFYMHNAGHWLGLDVHDAGEYKIANQWRPLEPSMVFTVEPGLYFSQNCQVPEKFQGIGIRIEDDILVTPMGKEVLTKGVPKQISEIEKLMMAARQ